jgi:hypothetical protein
MTAVSEVLVSPDGHRLERILVRRTLDGPAREMLRVKHGTFFVADCRTVAELAELVDLSTLVPEQRSEKWPQAKFTLLAVKGSVCPAGERG